MWSRVGYRGGKCGDCLSLTWSNCWVFGNNCENSLENSGGAMEKNSLSDENLKDQAIGLNPDKNLNTAFDSYPVLNMSEYEN